MTFLQIHSKAVTEADAQGVLQQLYTLEKPFGVPMLFVKPEAAIANIVPQHDLNTRLGIMENNLKPRVDAFAEKYGLDVHAIQGRGWTLEHLQHDAAHELAHITGHLSKAFPLHTKGFYKYADHYSAENYREPVLGLILLGSSVETMAEYAGLFLNDKNSQKRSWIGTVSQWEFTDAVHEMGHVIGAGEPETEEIAARAASMAFQNTTFLKARADWRAFLALNNFTNKKYGWPMVEVNDYVASLPEDAAPLTEQKLKALRFKSFDIQAEAVAQVGRRLHAIAGQSFQNRDFQDLAETAGSLHAAKAFEGVARDINYRFYVACLRLHHGEPAYAPDDDLVRAQELLEGQPFHTFIKTPEFDI